MHRLLNPVLRVLLTGGLLAVAPALALAQDAPRVWSFAGQGGTSTATDCTDCGDDVGLVLACQGASAPPEITVNWSAVEKGKEGDEAPLTLRIDGQVFAYQATTRLFGQIGYTPVFSLLSNDPVLEALAAGKQAVADFGGRSVTFGLKGARAALSQFVSACPWFATDHAEAPPTAADLAGAEAGDANVAGQEQPQADASALPPPPAAETDGSEDVGSNLPAAPAADDPFGTKPRPYVAADAAGTADDTAAPPDASAGVAPEVVTPLIIEVGKWAEGAVSTGGWLWVAESGQRSIAKIDQQTGKILAHVSVGRLPVGMASFDDGTVYALVQTDKAVWRQTAKGAGGVFARLSDCPQGMVADEPNLWVLGLPDCSSGGSRLTRIDRRGGPQDVSPQLGPGGEALTTFGGQVWVAHTGGDAAISVTEQATMRTSWVNAKGVSLWSITANAHNVYGGGRLGNDNEAGTVVMFDPVQAIEQSRISLPERIAQITANDAHVVAVGEKGTIWVLSAADLSIERVVSLSSGAFDPRAAFLEGNDLVVTAQRYQGENGAVFVVMGLLG